MEKVRRERERKREEARRFKKETDFNKSRERERISNFLFLSPYSFLSLTSSSSICDDLSYNQETIQYGEKIQRESERGGEREVGERKVTNKHINKKWQLQVNAFITSKNVLWMIYAYSCISYVVHTHIYPCTCKLVRQEDGNIKKSRFCDVHVTLKEKDRETPYSFSQSHTVRKQRTGQILSCALWRHTHALMAYLRTS